MSQTPVIQSLIVFAVAAACGSFARGDDCNQNGIDDLLDISSGVSADCNANAVPDECDQLRSRAFLEFSEVQALPGGATPMGIIAADFDGDSRPDIAAAYQGSGIVMVYRNMGGVFAPGVAYAMPMPIQVASHDLDNDSDLDLIVHGAQDIRILMNDGAGVFGHGATYAAAGSNGKSAYGDFDGDGLTDIIFKASGASLMRGLGDGTFAAPVTVISGHGQSVTQLAAADLDGDRDIDLALKIDSHIYAALNNGHGVFSRVRGPNYADGATRSVFVTDFDRDQSVDFHLVFAEGYTARVRNRGNGVPEYYGPNLILPYLGGQTNAMIAADLDGDGAAEYVACQIDGMKILRCDWTGSVIPPFFEVSGVVSASSVTPLDFDGDGDNDLAYTDGTTQRLVLLRNERVGNWSDANRNGILDACDLAAGTSPDCNGNLVPDDADVLPRMVIGFHVTQRLPAGHFINGLGLGDLDHDGDIDLVAASAGTSGGVQGANVFLNSGDGLFAPLVNYVTGNNPVEPVVAYVNDDEHLDVVVGNVLSDNVSVLLGTGDGTFENAVNFQSGAGPNCLRAADFDNDGDNDLIVIEVSDRRISIYLGDGSGTFSAGASYLFPASATALDVGDFDRDGDVDVAAAFAASPPGIVLAILLNNGPATLAAPVFYAANAAASSVSCGDMDFDGDVDIVTANGLYPPGNPTVSVFRNDGSGAFSSRSDFSLPIASAPADAKFADADGDGIVDIVVANAGTPPGYSWTSLSILRGTDDGQFAPAITYRFATRSSYVYVADLDRDGFNEILTTQRVSNDILIHSSHRLSAFADCDSNGVPDSCDLDCNRNGFPDACDLSTPRWSGAEPLESFASGAESAGGTSAALADFDGDGDLDAVVGHGDAQLVTTLRNVDGQFTLWRSFKVISNVVAASDLSGDGLPEILCGSGALLYSLENLGGGEFATPVSHAIAGPLVCILVADIDNDSDADAIAINGTTRNLLRNDGSGALVVESTSTGGGLFAVALDFDSDGDQDIAAIGASNLTMFRNAGNGNFSSGTNYAFGAGAWLDAADFDRDGDLDIAVARTLVGDDVLIFYNNGAGILMGPVLVRTGLKVAGPTSIVAADFTGDQLVDLAVVRNGIIFYLRNNGVGAFVAASLELPADAARWPIAGDVDNDGDVDLVAVHAGLPEFYVSPSSVTLASMDCNGNLTPDECDIASGTSPDVDQNGVPDECGICLGDFTADGMIGLQDLTQLLSHFGLSSGATYADGDIDSDGDVDLSDLTAFLARFGTDC